MLIDWSIGRNILTGLNMDLSSEIQCNMTAMHMAVPRKTVEISFGKVSWIF